MYFDNLPKIRIELEGMKYQIIHAFSSHNDEIEKRVAQELTKVIEDYPFDEEVSNLAKRIISQAIEETLKDYLLYGDGRKTLRQLIDKKISEFLSEE